MWNTSVRLAILCSVVCLFASLSSAQTFSFGVSTDFPPAVPTYDPTLTAGQTVIKRAHFMEIRLLRALE